jgi:Rod binding domain-containing protein
MQILPTGVAAGTAQAGGAIRQNDAAAQFDLMFYRMLLQSAKWTSGVAGGDGAGQAFFGEMVSDTLAQAAAAQQQGFGALMLGAADQPGKGDK